MLLNLHLLLRTGLFENLDRHPTLLVAAMWRYLIVYVLVVVFAHKVVLINLLVDAMQGSNTTIAVPHH
jgi:hypothetical protein